VTTRKDKEMINKTDLDAKRHHFIAWLEKQTHSDRRLAQYAKVARLCETITVSNEQGFVTGVFAVYRMNVGDAFPHERLEVCWHDPELATEYEAGFWVTMDSFDRTIHSDFVWLLNEETGEWQPD
jgi:hypothetical protein